MNEMDTSNKRRALGRGLEELFSNETIDFSKLEEKIVESTPKEEIYEISIDELRSNPYQPRKVFDEDKLQELAQSIKEYGIFQPVIVKKSIKGYEIIAGERRTRAATIAGLSTVPCIVRDLTDDEMMQIALIENLQRENLNAIEEAMAYNKLLSSLSITQDELAEKLGKSRSHITNMVGLLVLPEEVKDLIVENKVSMSHARVLSKIDSKEKAINLANKVINENLNVRQLEEISQNIEVPKRNKQFTKSQYDKEYTHVENMLCEKLGTKVKIRNNKLEINFVNVNDLNRILEIMNIED